MNTPFDLENITRKMIENLYKGNSKRLVNKTHEQLTKYGNLLVKQGVLNQQQILEVGAGNGELLPYVHEAFNNYYMTDISNWGKREIDEISKSDERVIFEIQNVENLSYADDYFDRIILTCVVAHLTEPFKALQELRRVTKAKGIISIFVSTDPSVLLRVIRKLIINKKMKNLTIPYKLYNGIEHRNTPTSIIEMVKWIYSKDKIKIDYYPFKLKSWNLSTHIIINITKN